MSEGMDKINNQIAAFIVCSAVAFSVPASASNYAGFDNNYLADASINMGTRGEFNQIISMYAAPQIPIEIVRPTPIEPPPAISMYAAPQRPIPIDPHPVFPIIEPIQEELPPQKMTPYLNESSLNLNKLNNPNTIEKIDKLEKINTNINKNVNLSGGAIRPDGFITTKYGNMKVIEPNTHFIFK